LRRQSASWEATANSADEKLQKTRHLAEAHLHRTEAQRRADEATTKAMQEELAALEANMAALQEAMKVRDKLAVRK